MPTYEYRCKECGTELEVVQAFTDDALTTCEACGGSLRKVFGNVGIAFKGSGFYKNDSRGKEKVSAGAGSGESSSSNGDSSSSSSSESTTKTDTSTTTTKTESAPAKKADAPAKSATKNTSKTA